MIEATESLPKTSRNHRIEAVFSAAPHLPNREFTLPIVGKPLYRAPVVKEDEGIQAVLEDNLRVIVTPTTVSRLNDGKRGELRTLASPPECGRVLELDDQVEIDGFPHTVSVKGIGATTFWRTTGNDGPFAYGRRLDPESSRILNRVPFLGRSGVFTARDALSETIESINLRKKGVDAELVLAVYGLDQMRNISGVLRPYQNFVGKGLHQITADSRPVLMFRAMKTNFRLLDPYMLNYWGAESSIPALLTHTIDQYSVLETNPNPTLQDYFTWLSGKVIRQELPIAVEGLDLSTTRRWSDLARNVSMLGEELDLEAMGQGSKARRWEYFEYGEHFRANFGNIIAVLNNLGEYAVRFGGDFGGIDQEQYAEHFWDTVFEVVGALDAERVTYLFHPTVLSRHGIDNDTFVRWIYGQMFRTLNNRYDLNGDKAFDPFVEHSLRLLDGKLKSSTAEGSRTPDSMDENHVS